MIFIFTGKGKGKTIAALGLGMRAVGAGKKVFLIQFLKPGDSSEIKTIKKIQNFDFQSFGRKGFFLPKKILEKNPKLKKEGIRPFEKIDFQLAKKGFLLAKKIAQSKKYHLLLLDEINCAIEYGLLKEKEVKDFLLKFKDKLDIVLTGQNAPKSFLKIADLVTEFLEKKHYYQKGILAKKGIDF